jgi:hypothetical protein
MVVVAEMKILGLMVRMGAKWGAGQAEGWWMDGGWQWWLRVGSRSPEKSKD